MDNFLYLNIWADGECGPVCGATAVLINQAGAVVDEFTGWVSPHFIKNMGLRATASEEDMPVYPAPYRLYRAFVKFIQDHQHSIDVVATDGWLATTNRFLSQLEEERFTSGGRLLRDRPIDAQGLRQKATGNAQFNPELLAHQVDLTCAPDCDPTRCSGGSRPPVHSGRSGLHKNWNSLAPNSGAAPASTMEAL